MDAVCADSTAPEATPLALVDSDRDLLARVAAGDGDAFTRLVDRHQRRLLRLAERMLGDAEEARDAVQEVFLKAYRKAATYTPRGQVYTWLYRITVNYCLNQLRRRNLVRFLRLEGVLAGDADGGPAFEPASAAPDPAAVTEARQRWRHTRAALDALPPGQRAVVVLVRFEGLSYQQAADTLGVSVGAVESRLFRATRTLEAAQEKLVPGVSPVRGAHKR